MKDLKILQGITVPVRTAEDKIFLGSYIGSMTLEDGTVIRLAEVGGALEVKPEGQDAIYLTYADLIKALLVEGLIEGSDG